MWNNILMDAFENYMYSVTVITSITNKLLFEVDNAGLKKISLTSHFCDYPLENDWYLRMEVSDS